MDQTKCNSIFSAKEEQPVKTEISNTPEEILMRHEPVIEFKVEPEPPPIKPDGSDSSYRPPYQISRHVTLYYHDPFPESRGRYTPVRCRYKGEERLVHPAACQWHKDVQDPECHQCERY